jgi:NLI interacting factor-like phosphatase
MDKHLILDLDGTLIDGSEDEIYSRPHLQEFLDWCFAHFASVSVWTAASLARLKKGLRWPFNWAKFLFTWCGIKCVTKWRTFGAYYSSGPVMINIKPLRKAWKKYPNLNKKNTLILDDTAYTYSRNYGNAVPISRFDKEDSDDDEPLKLIEWFPRIMEAENVRFIEKRNWSEDTEVSRSLR